ncbi:class I adenylate-forming enzyme family protein [Bacillus sp. FJAT-45037]|uniref:class I adenylate-forming enzyme family protein n=1 Tax=Bacillus sp. FJAT-45037 TaxID=2011007 RepID=UPI0018E26D87|nr:long-chain fatty acid--CoA ligase [Bacillus sp. FJAT-45037]
MFIIDQLKKQAQETPDQLITVFQEKETTYQEFYQYVEQLAGHFKDCGYEKEDIIALLIPNSDMFVICYYACQLAGVTVLPINHKLSSYEISYIINHSEAKGFIFDCSFEAVAKDIIQENHSITNKWTIGYEEGDSRIEDLMVNGSSSKALQQVVREAEDTAVVFYTSGTTGKPKGVMLSNENIRATAIIWKESMNLQATDRMQIVAPLFHCAASHVFTIPTIYAGGTVIIESAFSTKQALQTMEEQNVSIFFGVPAMYNLLLNEPTLKEHQFPSMRLLTYGAAPMPYELVKKVKESFSGVRVQNLYGQTENAPAATTLLDSDALTKIGSVGKALPYTDVRVVDSEGDEVPIGEVGEIIVMGPQVMKGYLKNREATNASLKNGWLYSGDLGRLDAEGFLYIVDRKKDMIIRGGENVYPVEVEEILYEISELVESAVIGVPDPVLGEAVKAYVVVKQQATITEDEIISYCRSRIAKYKCPSKVDFVEELPRNASGKVLKTTLRGWSEKVR